MPYHPGFKWDQHAGLNSAFQSRPNATTLTSLRLENSLIDSNTLAELLSATPNLQSLYYEFSPPFKSLTVIERWQNPAPEPWRFDFHALALALHQVPTLQELCITINWHANFTGPRESMLEISSEFSSLAPLTRLRKLAIQYELLLGTGPSVHSTCLESLPWSLESLAILYSFDTDHQLGEDWKFAEYMDKIRLFSENRGDGKSKLKEVLLEPIFEFIDSDTPDEDFEEALEGWQYLGKRNRVRCVEADPFDWDDWIS
ncbi:uncharacterized protein KD926_010296 [Aspergillus affinis]|uniref:uncharacterized protein n=1 Tax=Aspergillus affinis TaxID=1070780 RepID=UPI0022FEF432|nr:uncharacterized protein KD926_010296 [Aspergillus affinis]KAI9044973.1 hypothetical protein KD926_010296 [Aspergillus affinis]